MIRLRPALLPLAWLACLIVSGCGSDGSDLRNRISRDLGPIEDRLNFELVLPAYLPSGTEQTPTAIIGDEGRRLTMLFAESESAIVPVHEKARVEIIERRLREVIVTPPPEVEEFLDLDVERTSICGNEATIDRQEESDYVVFVLIGTRVSETEVETKVEWSNLSPDPGIRLTPEMEREGIRVVESMLEEQSECN